MTLQMVIEHEYLSSSRTGVIKLGIVSTFQSSGLSELVGKNLESFRDLDPLVSNLLFALVVAMATEVTSNTATATLLLPIVAELVRYYCYISQLNTSNISFSRQRHPLRYCSYTVRTKCTSFPTSYDGLCFLSPSLLQRYEHALMDGVSAIQMYIFMIIS